MGGRWPRLPPRAALPHLAPDLRATPSFAVTTPCVASNDSSSRLCARDNCRLLKSCSRLCVRGIHEGWAVVLACREQVSGVMQGGRASKIHGVHLAIVADNKDGDGNPGYRVKLKLPWLNDQETTFWARIAVPMAGP